MVRSNFKFKVYNYLLEFNDLDFTHFWSVFSKDFESLWPRFKPNRSNSAKKLLSVPRSN